MIKPYAFPADDYATDGSTNVFGILYAEDFDDPTDPEVDPRPPEIPREPEPPALTQADVDAACEQAVRAARVEWQSSRDRSCLDAISTLNATLDSMRDAANHSTLAVAEGTVATILAMVSGLLPRFAIEHGPAEVRALLNRLLPTIRSKERVDVRVHPDLVALVKRDLAGLDPRSAAMIDVTAAPLQPGDVKVSWESGSMVRDVQQLAQAVDDTLNELGLSRAVEAPAQRTMAHAE